MSYLVVIEQFPKYLLGQIVADAAEIKRILASEWRAHVVEVGNDAPIAPPTTATNRPAVKE